MPKKNTLKLMKKKGFIYLMILPVILYLLVFSYYPLILGIISSFRESRMIGAPEFAGLKNYADVFGSMYYKQALINTLILGIGTFLMTFVFGLLLALGLNELRGRIAKSAIQTVTFLPHLLSWTVVGGMWLNILSSDGLVNGVLKALNMTGTSGPVIFMSEGSLARPIMIITGAWKGSGYLVVLFMAAIVSIDPSVYEAAAIDGASRLRQITSIMVPNLVPTMKTIVVLSSMGILQSFDQIFVMGNQGIYDKVRTLMYLIYTDGIMEFKVGLATAAATVLLLMTMLISFSVRKLIKYDQSFI